MMFMKETPSSSPTVTHYVSDQANWSQGKNNTFLTDENVKLKRYYLEEKHQG